LGNPDSSIYGQKGWTPAHFQMFLKNVYMGQTWWYLLASNSSTQEAEARGLRVRDQAWATLTQPQKKKKKEKKKYTDVHINRQQK
jgi:hypothetical protein